MNLPRTRRILVAVGVAATVWLPLSLSAAAPASAHCQDRPIDDGGSGCWNSCSDSGLEKLSRKLGQEWACPQ